MLLSREQILEAKDLKTEDVPVPEWAPEGAENPNDYEVRLRTLIGEERDRFERFMAEGQAGGKKKQNLENFRARMITMCAVDDQGKPLFTTGDIKALGMKSSVALSRVFNKCQEMNGFTEADVEELTEDFDEGQDEPSTSG
ncbi:hypothetical protein DMA15_03500 [Streptomyces sp. WAC 01529]|uniref:hypothetical protein n=1 Tax=Streptomyces sp. WAC 01529 TaxID=2203205 RepID=UPI000F70C059|nr:hypothetical protein [Streptomyces sp. WAC 01529]AZM51758.1 hypothetical protein DMA15_03500 [Streptomyces sp. WAC 01529]